jgi:hypothetical protein
MAQAETKYQRYKLRKGGRVYCSKECGMKYNAATSSKTMAETNRKYASERMRERNPMTRPDSREKMKETLRRIGHHPIVQGGNGRGLTEPQKILLNALEKLSPVAEFIQRSKQGRYSGYPGHYKIDIAIPESKIAIEIDGGSHCALARREQDRKKSAFLESLGWTVLRLSNQQIYTMLRWTVSYITSKSKAIITTLPTVS